MKTVTAHHSDGTVDVVQRGAAAVKLTPGELETLYWRALRRTTCGLTRFRHDAVRVLGVWPAVLRFGPMTDGGRPIVGGLFARRPHGIIRWSADEGEVVVAVERFAPLLGGALWRLESWFHDVVGRRFLAAARGTER